MRQFFTVTPSFIIKMAELVRGQDKAYCMNLFEKISQSTEEILDGSSIDNLDESKLDKVFPIKSIIDNEDIPDHLKHLRNALEGAIENED